MAKVTVNIPDDLVQFLQWQARKNDVTFTEALRRAVTSEKFLVQQEEAGRRLLVEEKGMPIREVVRR